MKDLPGQEDPGAQRHRAAGVESGRPVRERSPPPLPDGTRRPAAARARSAPGGERVPMRRDEEEDAGTQHQPAQGERQPCRPADARRAGAVDLPPPDPPGGFGVHQAGFGPAPERRLPGLTATLPAGGAAIVPARSRDASTSGARSNRTGSVAGKPGLLRAARSQARRAVRLGQVVGVEGDPDDLGGMDRRADRLVQPDVIGRAEGCGATTASR